MDSCGLTTVSSCLVGLQGFTPVFYFPFTSTSSLIKIAPLKEGRVQEADKSKRGDL